MRLILLGYFLLTIAPFAWGNQDVKTFTQNLCQEDRLLLNKFFQSMCKSINGFVIYGDKPIGLKSYLNSIVYLPYGHENILARGKELWQSLNISPYNKEYLFAIFNDAGYCNFVAINRKAFIKTVNENLPLFRYVLGPALTAEALLVELIDAKNDFYKVLKNDNTLLGILLGYGTQNSLLGARSELICCDHIDDQKEEFPLLPYQVRVKINGEPKNQNKHPSFGFHTIFEEIESLNNRLSFSHNSPPMKPYALPFFGCESDSDETKKLNSTYQKNQDELLKAVEEPDFLENTLSKFLTTTSGTVEIPLVPSKKDPLFIGSRKEASDKLADLMTIDVQYMEDRSNEICLKSYLAGMEAQEKEDKESTEETFSPYWEETHNLNKDLVCSEQLKKADDYFIRLSNVKNLVCLIPNGIYYKQIRKGTGDAASSKIKKVSFHYSCKVLGEKRNHSIGTINQENPEYFISGMIHTLIGMKRGEERLVTIHPRYGYGDNSFFALNSALIVKVELIDFEEGDKEIAISPPYELKMKNIEEMQARFNQLKSKEYYKKGKSLWYAIKKTGDLIDLELVKKSIEKILTTDAKSSFKSIQEAHEYSVALQNYLLSKKTPATPTVLANKSILLEKI